MFSDWKGESLIMSLELQSKGITLSVKKKINCQLVLLS